MEINFLEDYETKLDKIKSDEIHVKKCIEEQKFVKEFLEERADYKVSEIYYSRTLGTVVIKASNEKFKDDIFIRTISKLDFSINYVWLEPCFVKEG